MTNDMKSRFNGIFSTDHIVKEWSNGEAAFAILEYQPIASYPPHYCGYVLFPRRPLVEEGYHGFVWNIPVHGGITFGREVDSSGRFAYGFDCAHAKDRGNPSLRDINWATRECERMEGMIVLAIPYEKRFLAAGEDEEEAESIVEEYLLKCEEVFGNLPDQTTFFDVIADVFDVLPSFCRRS